MQNRFLLLLTFAMAAQFVVAETQIIAHRGASAYLPEHTREAYLLAYGQGADFLEPDLVLSADGVLVALHDATLEATSNVAEVFPDRAREDGRFYAFDFTLAELRRLNFGERVDPVTGQARFPERWPVGQGRFGIVTFDDLLELTLELNRSTGRSVGVYPELKFPSLHHESGLDITAALIAALESHDSPRDDLPVFIQCFEPEPLQRIRAEHGDRYSLVQLIGENRWAMNRVNYDQMRRPEGLQQIAEYADGIGIAFARLIETDTGGKPRQSELFGRARGLGLEIHPYTLRRESMPNDIKLESMLDFLIHELKVEAVFTDHPDVALSVREKRYSGVGPR